MKKSFFLVLSASLLAASSSHAFKDYNNLQECLSEFKGVDKKTMPTHLRNAKKGDVKAVRAIMDFRNVLDLLPTFKYNEGKSGTDKAISGVETDLNNNKSEVVQAFLLQFKEIDENSMDNYVKQDNTDMLNFYKDLVSSLNSFGYQPKGSGTDTAISGVEQFFTKNSNVIQKNLPLDVNTVALIFGQNPSERKNLFEQTQLALQKGYRIGNTTLNIDTKAAIQGVQVYGKADDAYKPLAKKPNTKFGAVEFSVVNADTLDHAIFMKKQGLNPLVLDMANATLVAGACTDGRGAAQEEQIAYRSDLYPQLKHAYDKTQIFGKAKNFIPREGGIYVPRVSVIRESNKSGYKFMQQPVEISIGAIAAYRHDARKVKKKEVDSDVYPDLKNPTTYWASTANKLRALCDMAIDKGHDSLLLSAFGCGAFENPPKEMAEVIEKVLNEYKGYFKAVHFAIYSDNQQQDPNFLTFAKVFGNN